MEKRQQILNKNIDKERTMTLYKILTVILIVIVGSFFGYYSYMPGSASLYVTDYIDLAVICVCLIFLLRKASHIHIPRHAFIMNSFLGLWGISVVNAVLFSGESITSALGTNIGIPAAVLFYWVASQYYRDSVRGNYLEYALIYGAAIASAIAILVALPSGLKAFTNRDYRSTVAATIVTLGSLLVAGKLIASPVKNRKLIPIMLLCIIHIVFLGKTRMRIFMSILAVVFVFLVTRIKSKKNRLIIEMMLVTACIITLYASDLSEYSYSNAWATQNWSLAIRYDAIAHYFSLFLQKPLFGWGYAKSAVTEAGISLWSGYGQYYLSDVGIVGFLFVYGLLGLIWLLGTLRSIHKEIKRNAMWMPKEKYVGNYIIFMYLVFSMVTLIFTDNERIFYLPFLLLLLDNMYYGSALVEKEGEYV